MRTVQYCGTVFGVAVAMAVTAAPVFAVNGPSDSDITFWVRSALRDDPHIDASGIEVTVDKGIVTLGGGALNLATEEYAVQDSEKISGVVGVIDKLDLAAGWRPDFDIAQDVRHRIVNNEMIVTPWITVTSSAGAVTLSGKVASWAEKQEAGIVAGEVRGVRKVNNRLTVEYAGRRSDDDICKDVESKLDLNAYLNELPITVTVKEGVVTLNGAVGSKYEKELAEREIRYLAFVKGVTNNLNIERWENRGARTNRPQTPSDSDLRKQVMAVMTRDSRIDASKIEVDASHGHVTLTGAVPFMYQKRIAAQDAMDSVGVAWVTNELLVTGIPRQDDSIVNDILANLDSDYLLRGLDISIQARNGVVTLAGDVGTKWEQQHAEEIVTRVPGVKQIRNRIKVDQDQLSDDAVTRHVADRLSRNWITAPVRNDIEVTAKDGVVTLTGQVDTWAERAESAQIAMLTPGVWDVHDCLAVRGVPYPWENWDEGIIVLQPYYTIWP